jgi:hypothetical protein
MKERITDGNQREFRKRMETISKIYADVVVELNDVSGKLLNQYMTEDSKSFDEAEQMVLDIIDEHLEKEEPNILNGKRVIELIKAKLNV